MEFSGLVEIHITIDPQSNYIPLWKFTRENECKLIYACSEDGQNPNQYMISKFTNKNSLDEMMEKIRILEDKLTTDKIHILRSKIELMVSSEGVPKTEEDYQKVKNYLELLNKTKQNLILNSMSRLLEIMT